MKHIEQFRKMRERERILPGAELKSILSRSAAECTCN